MAYKEMEFDGSPIPCIPTTPGTIDDDAVYEVDLESPRVSQISDLGSLPPGTRQTWQSGQKVAFAEPRASKISVVSAADAAQRRSRYKTAEELAAPKKKARMTVQRVMTMTLERESNSGVKDPIVDMLSKESRELRRDYFGEVGQLVGPDEDGWPSCSTFVAKKMGFSRPRRCARRARPEYHPIEQFQRECISSHLLVTTMKILEASEIKWRYIRIYLKRSFFGCCLRRRPASSPDLLGYGLDDIVFCQIFEESWGCDMLRKPREGESTHGIEKAVVVDTVPWLKGLEVKEGCWIEPCKIIFTHDDDGLRPACILTEGDDRHPPLVSVNPDVEWFDTGSTDLQRSSHEQWLWAKRMAISACITVHQMCFHLCQHLAMEGVMCCYYTHLTANHYAFKIMEPLCGDVGFLNQTWGLELITGIRDPAGKAWNLCIADVLPLTGPALMECVSRGKKLLPLSHQFPFDEDGGCFMRDNCGVAEDAKLPVRNAALMVFEVCLEFVEKVVNIHWRDDDLQLARWWESIFWGFRAPKMRPLTKKNVAHILATFMMLATYCHDLAHNRWVYINHMYHVTFLYQGDMMDATTYTPDDDSHVILRAMLAGLMGDDLETPLTCYQEVFPECEKAVKSFSCTLKKIQAKIRHIDKFGSMTH
mmetsp:Transcript_32472/g.77132  ORF Transcript_32472/g.77132 Transcript_32472/m.77132 type:complete len:648 (+) Transcript_32472:41-1984(+)